MQIYGFIGLEGQLEEKNGKIFPKMFGELKNVVFLQPQIERLACAESEISAQLNEGH